MVQGTCEKKKLEDADMSPVLMWFEKGNRPNSGDAAILSPATRHYWLQWDSLCLKDKVLHRKFHRMERVVTITL